MGRLDPAGSLRANALSTITQALASLRESGQLATELETTAGPFVLTITHTDTSTGRYFVDLANLNIDLNSDTLTPVPAATLTWLIPLPLRAEVPSVAMYSSDGTTALSLAPTLIDQGTRLQLTLPTFRAYATVVIQ